MDSPTTVPLFLPHPPTRISECLADISAWTTAHNLKLILHKTELLCIPEKVRVEDVTVSPSSTAMNLGKILDDGLSCTANISAEAWSCRFALYNIHRSLSLLTNDTKQLLVQALVMSCLDYCNSLLAGLPASAAKPCIKNAAAGLFSQSTQILPYDPPLPWPPLASCCSLHSTQWWWWFWPSRPSMELHPSTSKHWSDQTPWREHYAPLHQLAGWYCYHWEQTKVAQRSHNILLFWCCCGGTSSWPVSGQQGMWKTQD